MVEKRSVDELVLATGKSLSFAKTPADTSVAGLPSNHDFVHPDAPCRTLPLPSVAFPGPFPRRFAVVQAN